MPNPNAPNNPPEGRMSMPQIERESQRIEQETERLHKDVEKLKRLRRLKQEEKELKRWMARQDAADQKPQVRNSDASANRDPTSSSDAPGYFPEPPPSSLGLKQIRKKSTPARSDNAKRHGAGNGDDNSGVDVESQSKSSPSPSPELKTQQDPAAQKPQVRNSYASPNRYPSSPSDAPGYFHEPPPSSLGLKQIRKKSTPTRYNNAKRHDAGNGDDNSNVDVESQSKSSPTPSPFRRALIKSRSISVASSKKWCRREVFPTARKVGMAILTGIDDETLQREDTERILIVITLIKEATFGILIAFAVVSLVLLLDHRLLLNIPTARNFRRATFHLMNDKETLRNFEENSGLKFMEMEEYAFMLDEIGKAANKTKLADDIFMTRSEDMVQMEKESKEYEQLISELRTSSGIDKFCPECIWSKKITCKQRGEALEKSNQLSKYQAMLAAMEDGLCLGEDHRFPRSKQQKAEEDELLVDWRESKQDFCRGCEWDKSTSCYHRLAHIHNTYGTSPRRAGAMIMVQQPWCRKSFHAEENKRLEKFCEDCVWGWEGKSMRTCVQQAEFLQRMHGYPESAVRLSVMERPACSYGQTGI